MRADPIPHDFERLQTMEKEAFVKNVPDFDGYIVKCSVNTPIEIKCENLV